MRKNTNLLLILLVSLSICAGGVMLPTRIAIGIQTVSATLFFGALFQLSKRIKTEHPKVSIMIRLVSMFFLLTISAVVVGLIFQYLQ